MVLKTIFIKTISFLTLISILGGLIIPAVSYAWIMVPPWIPSSPDEWRQDIQPGDILYDKDAIYSGLFGLITIGHTAIYFGDLTFKNQDYTEQVVESQRMGVTHNNVDAWDYSKRDNVYLLRVITEEQIKDGAIAFTLSQLNNEKPYDWRWWQKDSSPDAPSWYCSELVWAAYLNSSNGSINLDDNPNTPWVSPREIYNSSHVVEISTHTTGKEDYFKGTVFIIASPVDAEIIDPNGNVINKNNGTNTAGAYYIEDYIDENGNEMDLVVFDERIPGDYQINIAPEGEPGTYSLEVYKGMGEQDSEIMVQDENVPGSGEIHTYNINIPEPASHHCFYDEETSENNIFQAATLDFSLKDENDNSLTSPLFNISGMQKNESQKKIVRIKNDGILDFQYKINLLNVSGDLCGYLTLKAQLGGAVHYENILQNTNFPASHIVFSSPPDPKDWTFILTLANNAPENKSCNFDFVFDGAQIGATGFSDQETLSNAITSGTWTLPSSVQTIRIFPKADSFINSKGSEVNSNFGGDREMKIKSKTGDNKRGIIRFDLSVLPPGSTINSCSLNLFMHAAPPSSRNYGAHRVSNFETSWTETGVTWNKHNGSSNWNNAGGDFNPTATATISTGTRNNVWLSWSVSSNCNALAQRSWIIKDSSEDGSGAGFEGQFRTKEQGGTAEDSYLEINFTSPAVTTNHLVINEVYYDVGSGKGSETTNEWVEIYNPKSSAVDISNYKITDNSGTERTLCAAPATCSSTTIPAYGFGVITKAGSTWGYWTIPDSTTLLVLNNDIGNGLHDDNDRVILKDSAGTIVDAVSYGTDTTRLNPSIIDADEGWSIARIVKGYDTNSASDFWANPNPNPGTNPHSADGKELIIEEFVEETSIEKNDSEEKSLKENPAVEEEPTVEQDIIDEDIAEENATEKEAIEKEIEELSFEGTMIEEDPAVIEEEIIEEKPILEEEKTESSAQDDSSQETPQENADQSADQGEVLPINQDS